MRSLTITIRDARDLAQALAAPDLATRLAVLRAVASNPDRALAAGVTEGRDVIALLLEQVAGPITALEWQALATALAAFQDRRVVVFFRRVLATSEDPALLAIAVERLATEPVAPMRTLLSEILMEPASPSRSLAAARLLAPLGDLSIPERIRAALVLPGSVPAPALTDETAAAWIAELDGFYDRQARQCLEAQGLPAFAVLAARWETLSDSSREWLLGWGTRCRAPGMLTLAAKALESGTRRLVLAALECLAQERDGRLGLDRWLRHPDPAVRRAAAAAGAEDVDWREFLERESDHSVRQAYFARLARTYGEVATAGLDRALASEDRGVDRERLSPIVEQAGSP